MSNVLKITWHNEESGGYIDLVPMAWFRQRSGKSRRLSHVVLNPRGKQYTAQCIVTVHSKFVDLDFGHNAVAEYNTPTFYLGVSRVHFRDTRRQIV